MKSEEPPYRCSHHFSRPSNLPILPVLSNKRLHAVYAFTHTHSIPMYWYRMRRISMCIPVTSIVALSFGKISECSKFWEWRTSVNTRFFHNVGPTSDWGLIADSPTAWNRTTKLKIIFYIFDMLQLFLIYTFSI